MTTTTHFQHQYIQRESSQPVTEHFLGDRSVSFLYNTVREHAPAIFKALTSARMSRLLSFYHYDFLDRRRTSGCDLFNKLNIDWRECVQPCHYYDTPRKIFERQIQYALYRPMEDCSETVASPADSRVITGSFSEVSRLHIKEKFFTLPELLGNGSTRAAEFQDGDFAVFRLTPDKYHYNHTPVSGIVEEIYEVDGAHHSCNPLATVSVPSIYAKNKRVVTIIDTDVEGGTGVGPVIMVEVVALMIGEIVQAYSESGYKNPQPLRPGMFITKGQPKSLYRPGSSTDILIFRPNRIAFSEDLVRNAGRLDITSRFRTDTGKPLVETDIRVRSTIARRI